MHVLCNLEKRHQACESNLHTGGYIEGDGQDPYIAMYIARLIV